MLYYVFYALRMACRMPYTRSLNLSKMSRFTSSRQGLSCCLLTTQRSQTMQVQPSPKHVPAVFTAFYSHFHASYIQWLDHDTSLQAKYTVHSCKALNCCYLLPCRQKFWTDRWAPWIYRSSLKLYFENHSPSRTAVGKIVVLLPIVLICIIKMVSLPSTTTVLPTPQSSCCIFNVCQALTRSFIPWWRPLRKAL